MRKLLHTVPYLILAYFALAHGDYGKFVCYVALAIEAVCHTWAGMRHAVAHTIVALSLVSVALQTEDRPFLPAMAEHSVALRREYV